MKQWITSIILISLLSPMNTGCARGDTLDEQVETIGQHLARWSNYYHQTIKINDKPVNIMGPNAGGYSNVYWQMPLAMGYGDQWLASTKEQNRVIRENLKQIVKQNNCNLKEITTYLKQFVDPSMQYTNPKSWDEQVYKRATPEVIAKELGCLGKFEFKEVVWGME